MGIKFIHDNRNGTDARYMLKPSRILLNEMYTATDGQTSVRMAGYYTPGRSELEVYLNGVPQRLGIDYNEISDQEIQFIEPLEREDIVQLIVRGTYVVSKTQTFVLEEDSYTVTLDFPYFVGGETIMVFANGKLLTPQVDYYEEDEYTLRFDNLMTLGTTIVVHEMR